MTSSKLEGADLTIPMLPEKPLSTTEKDRINPAYTELADLRCDALVPGVVYIWVLKANRSIVVGIEKPWEHPEAFHSDPKDKEIWEIIVRQLQTTSEPGETHEGLGHPTLSVSFSESGAIDVGLALAHLGGELWFKDDHWILDNRSGRYGRARETNPDILRQMQYTLDVVADQFKHHGIEVTPELYRKSENKFYEFNRLLKNSCSSKPEDSTPEEKKAPDMK